MIDTVANSMSQTDASVYSPTSLALGDYYRALYGQIRGALETPPQNNAIVGVTSCLPREGVSTVCHHVAIAAALQLRRPVLLLDATGTTDRTPPNSSSTAVGLYEILAGQAEPADCIRPGSARDMFVLSAGARPGRGQGHFPRDAFADLLVLLRREFAFVLVDLPTCNELTDCLAIAGMLDGVLMVVEAERVRSQVVAHARDHLFQAGSRFLGVVLNKRKNHVPEWLYRRL